ncbi:hypothetical protein EVAR_87018_1 [Eumeta japonica]|uniref:Uncharacterized protein n=1 Tax=Eumeta variegata TaxID=151549 RepID=A0A4C1W9F0_EUMVA|nr:hypothetical protein EVAR_87018_1 [Eumeta japonica]
MSANYVKRNEIGGLCWFAAAWAPARGHDNHNSRRAEWRVLLPPEKQDRKQIAVTTRTRLYVFVLAGVLAQAGVLVIAKKAFRLSDTSERPRGARAAAGGSLFPLASAPTPNCARVRRFPPYDDDTKSRIRLGLSRRLYEA